MANTVRTLFQIKLSLFIGSGQSCDVWLASSELPGFGSLNWAGDQWRLSERTYINRLAPFRHFWATFQWLSKGTLSFLLVKWSPLDVKCPSFLTQTCVLGKNKYHCKWKIVSVRKSCKEMLLLVTLYSQPRLRSLLCLQVRISHDFVKLSPGDFMVSHMQGPLVSHNASQDSASCKTCETWSGAICDLE